MKVTRTITFESDDYDTMERQCRYSGPDGTFKLPSGNLTITITTTEQDIPKSIQESLQFANNMQWIKGLIS